MPSVDKGIHIPAGKSGKDELELIFAGIKSLDSVSKHPRADIAAVKMGKLEDDTETIGICLSSFYKFSVTA